MPGTPTATPCSEAFGTPANMSGVAPAGAFSRVSMAKVRPLLGEVDHHEAAAADAGRLRLDHVQRIGDSHRGIDGVAALLEDLRAGFGAIGVGHR